MTTQSVTPMRAAGLPIPEQLVKAIKYLRGDEGGLEWLTALDGMLREYMTRWKLQLGSIAEGGAMSCCVFCIGEDGTDLVLKVPVEPRSGVGEAATLRRWVAFDVAPRVVHVDATSGVFLMERVLPGTTFAGIGGVEDLPPFLEMFDRLEGAGRKMDRLDVPELSSLMDDRLGWARVRFDDPEVAPLRPNLEFVAELANSLGHAGNKELIHGDLQAKNVLWGPNGRIFCIDPLTAWGDRASDVAMWAVLQDTNVPITAILRALTAQSALDPERLDDWAYAIATIELRPAQAERYSRQRQFLDEYERAHMS